MTRWVIALLLALIAAPVAAASSGEAPRQVLACLQSSEVAALPDCVRPLAEASIACLLCGEGTAACLGFRDAGLVGACLLAIEAMSVESLAGCLALRLVAREAAKCLHVGIGVPGGCFGPGNTLRQWGEQWGAAGRAAWADNAPSWARLPGF